MKAEAQYDVAVIGGGLAGLSVAIQLAKQDFRVLLFERERYPFHKVCGEYISMESWCFLQHLGVSLHEMNLPIIHKLHLTAPDGKSFTTHLPLGGFGISRFKLDALLCQIARQNGVQVLEETRVNEVTQQHDKFQIQYTNQGVSLSTTAAVCCGAFGKRSNLDVRWKRDFIAHPTKKENNYIAVKYHVKTDWPEHTIGLHNFKNGYCGISKVEGDRYCLCYLTTAANLKAAGNSIEKLQQNVLSKNPALHQLFQNLIPFHGFPISIAQVSFAKKTQVENGVLMLGDAGGMIAPLCGNGMSMALHGSKIAFIHLKQFLEGNTTRNELEAAYTRQWNKTFASRLAAGRAIQGLFGSKWLTDIVFGVLRRFPKMLTCLVNLTHGRSF